MCFTYCRMVCQKQYTQVGGEWHGNPLDSVQMHGQQLELTNLVRLILNSFAMTADLNGRTF